MDKIDQRSDELYRNWQAEYRDAVTSEDCKERRKFINHTWRSMNSNIRFLPSTTTNHFILYAKTNFQDYP